MAGGKSASWSELRRWPVGFPSGCALGVTGRPVSVNGNSRSLPVPSNRRLSAHRQAHLMPYSVLDDIKGRHCSSLCRPLALDVSLPPPRSSPSLSQRAVVPRLCPRRLAGASAHFRTPWRRHRQQQASVAPCPKQPSAVVCTQQPYARAGTAFLARGPPQRHFANATWRLWDTEWLTKDETAVAVAGATSAIRAQGLRSESSRR